MSRKHVLLIALAAGLTTGVAFAQTDSQIPGWVKTVAVWWGQGMLDDSEFVNAMQFLLDARIITLPSSQIQEPGYEAALQDAYDRGYAEGRNAALLPAEPGRFIHGVVTKNIDGNTIDISGDRIRSPFVWVVDSGNKDSEHARYAKELCPVGADARYDVDDLQPKGKYGRTIAIVWCEGHEKSLDQLMVESGLGWISKKYCLLSEFKNLDWVNGCRDAR